MAFPHNLNLSPKLPSESIETTNAKFEFEIDNLIKFEAVYKLASKDTRTNMMDIRMDLI